MSILYILLEIIVITLFILIKKTDKKENILLWIHLSIIILMCLNIFTTFIFNTIKIKSTLTNLSCVLIALIISMAMYLYKTKKFQKYFIKWQDICATILIIAISVAITYVQFGFPFNIYYEITDAATHYNTAVNFYEYSDLLTKSLKDDIVQIFSFETFMTGSYVNLGILFKSLSSFMINTESFVSVSIIFEMFIFYLAGMLMYFLLSNKLNKKSEFIVALLFTILYMLGYPLNSEISGFSYLSLGMNIIISIIIIIQYFLQNKINRTMVILILFLLNFGLFFTYYFFVPVVYISIFITILIQIKREKKIKMQNIIELTYILILPFLCGIYYFYLRGIVKGEKIAGSNAIRMDGDIYGNLITNFILFIPFVIIYSYYQFKNRENAILNKLLVTEILFILVLGIGLKLDIVSEYYFYKAYYFLWILIIIMAFEGIVILIKKSKKIKGITYTLCLVYIATLMIEVLGFNNPAIFFDIYNTNYLLLKNKTILIENEYFKIVDYYSQNLNEIEDDNIYIRYRQ